MIQIQLAQSELAYLLHLLNASAVIGVDNLRLFPSDTSERKALLDAGFVALQENGWVRAVDNQYSTNPTVVLLVAAIAVPEIAIVVRHSVEDGGEQAVSYYLAQDMVVEQYLSAEKKYRITQLDNQEAIVERLQIALGIPDTEPDSTLSFVVEPNALSNAIAQARSGEVDALAALLSASHSADDDPISVARQIGNLQPTANIELAALAGERVVSLAHIVLLRYRENIWAISDVHAGEGVQLETLSRSSFTTLLNTQLKKLRSLLSLSTSQPLTG